MDVCKYCTLKIGKNVGYYRIKMIKIGIRQKKGITCRIDSFVHHHHHRAHTRTNWGCVYLRPPFDHNEKYRLMLVVVVVVAVKRLQR